MEDPTHAPLPSPTSVVDMESDNKLVTKGGASQDKPHHGHGPSVDARSSSSTRETESENIAMEAMEENNIESNLSSGQSTPHRPRQMPPLISFASSVIEVKREEKKTWYQDARKGYKITTKYFYEEVDSSWTAVMIVVCYFVSGVIDAVAFGIWGVFVAMQTGNTIFLASRITNPPETHHPVNYAKSLISVGCYLLGSLMFNCLHRAPVGLSEAKQPLRRWILTSSFLIQATILVLVAILAQAKVLSGSPKQCGTFSSGTELRPGDNYLDLLGIGLLALETAGQVCLSRVLTVNELPTIVLSTLYHDLVGEALSTRKHWKESKTWWEFVVSQKKQFRRAMCILALFVGALIGGQVLQSRGGLAAALWLAAGVKLVVAISWCLWRRKSVVETVVQRG